MGCGGDAREGFYGNFSSLTASYERKFYAVVICITGGIIIEIYSFIYFVCTYNWPYGHYTTSLIMTSNENVL